MERLSATMLLIITPFLFSISVKAENEDSDKTPPTALTDQSATSDEADQKHLQLLPGQTTTIVLPTDPSLNISRRGVIDLHPLGKNQWQLTALRAGIVLIQARSSAAAEPAFARFLVTVKPAEQAHKSTRGRSADLPEWLCQPNNIICDQATGIVSGQAPSWDWLVQAAQACLPIHGCLLQAQLDERARDAWKDALAIFEDPDKLVVTPSGFILWSHPCNDDATTTAKSPFPEGLVPKTRLSERCATLALDQGYDLHARIYLVDENTARNLGFDSRADGALSVMGPGGISVGGSLLARLEALAASHRATIVGQPRIRLLAGREVTLRAGGEFQVAEFRDQRQGPSEHAELERQTMASSWKQTGLEMTIKATALQNDAVRIDFEAALRLRAQSSGEPSLSVGSIKSAIDTPLDQPQLAATLDLESQIDSTAETPALASLPLIGPLFRKLNAATAHHRLIIWITASRPTPALTTRQEE